MSPFRWGMLVAGAFLVLYAALNVLGAKGGKNKRRATLGCGFVLLAGAVWGYALGGFMGGVRDGMRLGLACALVLPALAALANPGRRGAVAAGVMLVLAVVLGAPVVPRLLQGLGSSSPSLLAEKVAGSLEEARDYVKKTGKHIEHLEDSRRNLRKKIAARGHGDFESLAADAEAYALLTEMGDVDRLLQSARSRLERLNSDVPELESALRRLERLQEAESATGERVDEAEIERIVERLRADTTEPSPVTVEEHMQREALRALFEGEFSANTDAR